jgi:hypothetical protein
MEHFFGQAVHSVLLGLGELLDIGQPSPNFPQSTLPSPCPSYPTIQPIPFSVNPMQIEQSVLPFLCKHLGGRTTSSRTAFCLEGKAMMGQMARGHHQQKGPFTHLSHPSPQALAATADLALVPPSLSCHPPAGPSPPLPLPSLNCGRATSSLHISFFHFPLRIFMLQNR